MAIFNVLSSLTVYLALTSTAFATNPADWTKVTRPSPVGAASQSIGNYNSGCISGAVALPYEGIGYQLMRLSRNRAYGHPDLKLFIENLGQMAAQQRWGGLLIGDLSQPRGGPTKSGHRSHQTGLDVDIWFLTSNRKLTAAERENWNAPSVLLGNTDALNLKEWSANSENILQTAAQLPAVDRIFVNPSIKRELCHKSAGNWVWLRKIRPWWKHDDHFHVRLKCPANSPHCQNQEPLPIGDGCDASLAWWFSVEAKTPSGKIQEPYKQPTLPNLCTAVLKAK